MTKPAEIKKQAKITIRNLNALQKLSDTLVTGKPAPKARSKRKTDSQTQATAKKHERQAEDYDTALWDVFAD